MYPNLAGLRLPATPGTPRRPVVDIDSAVPDRDDVPASQPREERHLVYCSVRDLDGIIGQEMVDKTGVFRQMRLERNVTAADVGYPSMVGDRAYWYLRTHGYTPTAVHHIYDVFQNTPNPKQNLDFALILGGSGMAIREATYIHRLICTDERDERRAAATVAEEN